MLTIYRNTVKQAKKEHDREYMNFDLDTFHQVHEGKKTIPFGDFQLNEIPYYPDSSTISKEAERSKRIYQFNSLVNNHLMEGDTWKGNDLMNRMNFFLRRKTQKLCKGSVSHGIFGYWVDFSLKKDMSFFDMSKNTYFFIKNRPII